MRHLQLEYKALERRCDALKNAHQSLLRVAKVYSTEPYDYPTNINESLGEIGSNVSHSLTFWASQATKNTALPKIEPTEKVTEQKKTLPHALSRAAAGGEYSPARSEARNLADHASLSGFAAALELTGGSAAAAADTTATSQGDVRLGRSLQAYAVAQDKIGAARLAQDAAITNNFYKPWTSTLNNQINAAVKARQHVKSARLSLDAARAKYKHLSTGAAGASSNAQKVEQARLEVEAAEETLVTATEEAINLMRAVLDNVSGTGSHTYSNLVVHADTSRTCSHTA